MTAFSILCSENTGNSWNDLVKLSFKFGPAISVTTTMPGYFSFTLELVPMQEVLKNNRELITVWTFTRRIHFQKFCSEFTVINSKCNCIGGRKGCCKYVALLLFSSLLFGWLLNLGIHYSIRYINLYTGYTEMAWFYLSKYGFIKSNEIWWCQILKRELNESRKGHVYAKHAKATCNSTICSKSSQRHIWILYKDLSNDSRALYFCKIVQFEHCQPTQFFKTSSSIRQYDVTQTM